MVDMIDLNISVGREPEEPAALKRSVSLGTKVSAIFFVEGINEAILSWSFMQRESLDCSMDFLWSEWFRDIVKLGL